MKPKSSATKYRSEFLLRGKQASVSYYCANGNTVWCLTYIYESQTANKKKQRLGYTSCSYHRTVIILHKTHTSLWWGSSPTSTLSGQHSAGMTSSLKEAILPVVRVELQPCNPASFPTPLIYIPPQSAADTSRNTARSASAAQHWPE